MSIVNKGKCVGEERWNWKGGQTELRYHIGHLSIYRNWRKEVLARDGKCAFCSSTTDLQADHLIRFASILDTLKLSAPREIENYPWAFDVRLGRTLCKECHTKIDDYGYNARPANKEEFTALQSQVMTMSELWQAVILVTEFPDNVEKYISTRSDYLEFANKVLSEV